MTHPAPQSLRVFSLVLLVQLLICQGCSGGSGNIPDYPESAQALQDLWPPPDHAVSDDQVFVKGNQYLDSGGFVFKAPSPPDAVDLYSSGDISWAMYSSGGYSPEILLQAIRVDFTLEPEPGSMNPAKLYVGLADYTYGGWRWFTGESGSYTVPFVDSQAIISPNGNAFLVACIDGRGSATVEQIVFDRVGDTDLEVPEISSVTADLDQITISWDPVPGATGYNVYRNAARDSEEWELVTTEPVEDTTFVDTTVGRGFMYYYRVSGVNPIESELSDRRDIFSPQADVPLPQNARVVRNTEGSFTIGWDWEGERPSSWHFLLKEVSDFDLFDPIFTATTPGFISSYTFHDLVPGKTYFWRMCARQSGYLGRMTDDELGTTKGLWTWEPVEDVDSGLSPFAVEVVDNDLSVAYLSLDARGRFARRSAGTWDAETVLVSMVDSPGGEGVISSYIDMVYAGGKYLVVGLDSIPADVVGAVGVPGNWTQSRIDGDGGTYDGHPLSGYLVTCAASDTEFVITYQNGITLQLAYQSTPIDVINWTPQTAMWDLNHGNSQFSMAGTTAEVFLLWYEPTTGLLELADYDGGNWNRIEIAAPPESGYGYFNDLTLAADGDWYTPAVDPASFEMRVLSGMAPTWASTPIVSSDRIGEFATMSRWGDGLAMTFKNRDLGIWMFGIYSGGSWEILPLSVPGTDIRRAEIAVLNDTPYLVFHDREDDMIKCAPGTPPE